MPENENADGWKQGTVTHAGKKYTFQAKVYDEGSDYGINGGRVSKLSVIPEGGSWGACVIDYDRGWGIQPSSEHQPILEKILALYNTSDAAPANPDVPAYLSAVDREAEGASRYGSERPGMEHKNAQGCPKCRYYIPDQHAMDCSERGR